MPIGILEQKYFLSPREAVEQLVGPATFGGEWEPNIDADDARMQGAIQNLQKVLQSGEVSATYTYGDGIERELTAAKAAGDFFKIDLKRDCCYLDIEKYPPCGLKINKLSLELFLRKFESRAPKALIVDVVKCEAWIRSLIKPGKRLPTNEELLKAATAQFVTLTKAGFRQARANAIAAERRDDLRRGGRPPGPRQRAPSLKT